MICFLCRRKPEELNLDEDFYFVTRDPVNMLPGRAALAGFLLCNGCRMARFSHDGRETTWKLVINPLTSKPLSGLPLKEDK